MDIIHIPDIFLVQSKEEDKEQAYVRVPESKDGGVQHASMASHAASHSSAATDDVNNFVIRSTEFADVNYEPCVMSPPRDFCIHPEGIHKPEDSFPPGRRIDNYLRNLESFASRDLEHDLTSLGTSRTYSWTQSEVEGRRESQ